MYLLGSCTLMLSCLSATTLLRTFPNPNVGSPLKGQVAPYDPCPPSLCFYLGPTGTSFGLQALLSHFRPLMAALHGYLTCFVNQHQCHKQPASCHDLCQTLPAQHSHVADLYGSGRMHQPVTQTFTQGHSSSWLSSAESHGALQVGCKCGFAGA